MSLSPSSSTLLSMPTKRLFTAMLVAAPFLLVGCGGGGDTVAPPPTTLRILDTVIGTGATATTGSTVTVNYVGYLFDGSVLNVRGTKFDSSLATGRSPFSFTIGAGQVIQGWEQGLIGMKVGGQRTLVIPADLAYGATGAGSNIPPNSTLVFDIALLSVQ